MINKHNLYLGNNLDILKTIDDNSIDSVVTDPPYGISFMNKKWDYDVPSIELWKEILRVLKPGGYLLSFGGTRTHHRMTVRIEDAGFEIRDMIAWVYGSGFPKSLNVGVAVNKLETKEWLKISKALDNISTNDYIDVWKNNLNGVKFTVSQSEKNIIEIGMNTQKNDSVQGSVLQKTNQEKLNVSAIIAEIPFGVHQAINTKINIVQENVEANTKQSQNLVKSVAKLSPNQSHKFLNIFTAECDVQELLKEKTVETIRVEEALMTLRGNQKYSNEETINVLCAVLTDILKHTILNQSKIFQNLGTNLQTECVSAINVTITESIMECLIINMVNIANQITVDKLQVNEREVVGKIAQPGSTNKRIEMSNGWQNEPDLTKGTSEWEGWGTALKPALEPIVVARKPLSEKTIAKNVIKWETGGINIDECRVPTRDIGNRVHKTNNYEGVHEKLTGMFREKTNWSMLKEGRYPANFIHDGSDEVLNLFPNSKSGKYKGEGSKNGGLFHKSTGKPAGREYEDEGTAARFFYCAKASKSERNLGIKSVEEKKVSHDGRNKHTEGPHQRHNNVQKNHHPTVKPIALMEYLCKLITPKGGVVLDPFMGSGTTGIAAIKNNYSFIGIEKEEDYINIAKQRIDNAVIDSTKNKQLSIIDEEDALQNNN